MIIENNSFNINTEKDFYNNSSNSNENKMSGSKEEISSLDFYEKDSFIVNKSWKTPLQIYADNVIKNAVADLEKGIDIENNKKIIRIYSAILKENPENNIRKLNYAG